MALGGWPPKVAFAVGTNPRGRGPLKTPAPGRGPPFCQGEGVVRGVGGRFARRVTYLPG